MTLAEKEEYTYDLQISTIRDKVAKMTRMIDDCDTAEKFAKYEKHFNKIKKLKHQCNELINMIEVEDFLQSGSHMETCPELH